MGGVTSGPLFDEAAIRWLQQFFGTSNRLPFELVSLLGDTWGLLLVLAIALWRFDRWDAYAVAAAITVTSPLWLGLASLFSVSRPSGPDIMVLERLAAGAFPSGHVFHAVTAWWVLAARTRIPLWVPLLVGLATGVGRIYMGVHYPADVLASLIMAPAFAWAFVQLWGWGEEALRERQRERQRERERVTDRNREASPGRGDGGASWIAERTGPWLGLAVVAILLVGLTLALLGPLDPGRLRRWELVGIAYGGPVAVLVHIVWTSARSAVEGVAPLVIGFAGLALLTALSRAWLGAPPWVGAVATGLALVWIFVAVPALLGRRRTPDRTPDQVSVFTSGPNVHASDPNIPLD